MANRFEGMVRGVFYYSRKRARGDRGLYTLKTVPTQCRQFAMARLESKEFVPPG